MVKNKLRSDNNLNEIIKNLKRNKFKKIEISDKKINSLKIENGWQGDGSEFESIIIDELKGLQPNLLIHRSTLHYIIKDTIIYKLKCRNTQNITIENCTIYKLDIQGCYNMTLRNNRILHHKIIYTKGNVFVDNQLSQIEKLEEKDYNTITNPLGRNLSNPAICCLYFLAISAFLSRTFFWFIGFIPVGLLILLKYLYYARIKRIEDKKDNFYVNNTELQNKNAVFKEILVNYKDFKISWFQYNLPVFSGIMVGIVITLLLIFVILS